MFLHKVNYVTPPFVPLGNAQLRVPLAPVRFGTGSLGMIRGFGQDYGGVAYYNLANTIGTGDFTAECWVYAENPNGLGFSALNNFLGFGPRMTINATYKLVPGNPPTYQYTYTIGNGTYDYSNNNVYMGFWGYVCLMRYNGRVYFFADPGNIGTGTPVPTNTATLDSVNFQGIPNSDFVGTTFLVGCNESVTKGFNGYIDQVRVSNIARYSGSILNQSYQVPQSQFTVDANTVLLAGYDGTFANEV